LSSGRLPVSLDRRITSKMTVATSAPPTSAVVRRVAVVVTRRPDAAAEARAGDADVLRGSIGKEKERN
jgi:hypothetical protein